MTPEQNVDFATVLNEAFFTGEFYNGVQLSSLFTKKPNSGTAKNQLNKLLESSPKYHFGNGSLPGLKMVFVR